MFTSDDQPGWSMDSNPIHHPSPAKRMKSWFLYYIELLMISRAGWWTRTPSATPLQPQKWNAHFWILFNFWWSAGLVNGLKPHPTPLCTQKNEMLIFGLRSTSDDEPGLSMDLNSIHHLSPAKKWNAHILIMFNFWWLAGLFNRLEPHPPPLSTQKNGILIFVLCSTSDVGQTGQWTQTPSTTPLQPIKWNASFWIMFTSDDQPGWLMDSNPIWHPSPAKEIKCSFLYYVQLLMISWADRWTQTPSAIPLQPKKWNAHFCITFNFWCWLDWSMDSNPIHHPSAAKKMKCFSYGLHSTSDDWPGWVMDSNPICHPSPANKMKCFFLDYVQLLMISRACRWTWTLSTTCLQLKNEMLIFGLCSTSDD